MYHIYILRSKKDGKLYIGKTKNLARRLKEHYSGQSKATKNRLPMKLIYVESYLSSRDAARREVRLKKFKNSYTELKKRLKGSLEM
jgi:putative endonuclease